jgi:hypothetical protein
MAEKRNLRFRLVPYQILARHWMIPAILMIPAGYGFRWSVTQLEQFNSAFADLGYIISIAGVLLTLYTISAGLSSLIIQEDRFILRAPLHPLAISYTRIKLIYPMEFRLIFPRKQVKRLQYRLYRKLWRMTVPVVMLEGLPVPRWWLKLWFHPFLIHPDEEGIILVVRDWMACSRALDSMRSETIRKPWQTQR